ncbi:hypothetical protein Golomagni_06888 [Golovinomyces magnicellulatus]|nr:hypothetical protein Golomagni_06888 [Golovinomyces magnicellulatus]
MEERISSLVNWATEHGAILHPSVEIYQDPCTGLSFQVKPSATTPVAPYETIVSLPTNLTLSYASALNDQSNQPFHQDVLTKLKPHVIGRLFLVKEYLLGKESFWWPYIQALSQPNDRDEWALAPFWPADEAELLEGTNVEIGLEKIRADVKRELRELERVLDGCGDKLATKITPALYQWAYCIFSSRSFRPSLVLSDEQRKELPDGVGIDDFSVLLPLFDLGNHDMTTPIRWELNPNVHACELNVGKEHQPGQQVFNNYSMKTNAELLLGYGFMIPPTQSLHNDYTHVRKRTSDPAASEEYLISSRPLKDESSLLVRSKLDDRAKEVALKTIAAFTHVPPDMVWDIFCTLTNLELRETLMPGVQDEERQSLFLQGKVQGECVMYLEQTVAIIQHKMLQELERLDETDVEVVSGQLTPNQTLAIEYRQRCRTVLESTLMTMNEDLDTQ